MTSVLLKLLAMLFMTIDHVGLFFLNNNMICRGIGRAAFPLFVFLFCEGFLYTRNPKKRMFKIFALALITEPIFDILLFRKAFCLDSQNVLWLFALTGLACLLLKHSQNWYDKVIFIAVPIVLAEFFGFDYGAAGASAIFICYYAVKNKDKIKNYKLAASLSWLPLITSNISHIISGQISPVIALGYIIPVFVILTYNGNKGKSNALLIFFMITYYPLHLAAILLIRTFL